MPGVVCVGEAGGGVRQVLHASASALQREESPVLAVVMETAGSTYASPGALAVFNTREGRAGWLSGGCIEAEIALQARAAAVHAQVRWLEVDTRDDDALLLGAATGCRGRLRIALVPLPAGSRWSGLLAAWRRGARRLWLRVDAEGVVCARVGQVQVRWSLSPVDANGRATSQAGHVAVAASRTVAIFGAGPEAALLVPLMRGLGWFVAVVERRPRWVAMVPETDALLQQDPASALRPQGDVPSPIDRIDAALVMHHDFELDREALLALAPHAVRFVGLLGPVRRQQDLFRVLPESTCAALAPRLRSPVGLALGGRGPEAIALSIAAQLHQYGVHA